MPLPEAKPEARIELLIRGVEPEGSGFKIKEVPSGHVYAGYRPARIDSEGYEIARERSALDGRMHHVLKASGSSKYLYLNEREHFLWEMMDGSRSIKDIATAYYFEYGSLDFSAIKGLLSRLREAGLIEFVPASRLRVALDRSKRPWARKLKTWLSGIDYRMDDADGWVGRLYDRGGYLLVNKFAVGFYILLSVMGIATFGKFESVGRFPYNLIMQHPLAFTAVLVMSVYPVAALHELAHALACKRFGRKVYAFGFTLWDGFYPSFYTDVSDIYLAPRSQRILVSLAGPLSTTAIAALFFIPALISPDAAWAESFYQVGRLNLIFALVSAYPFQFVKMDGYYMLVDILGMPGLRERAFALLKGLPESLHSGRRPTRTDVIMVSYFALSALSLVAFVTYFFSIV